MASRLVHEELGRGGFSTEMSESFFFIEDQNSLRRRYSVKRGKT